MRRENLELAPDYWTYISPSHASSSKRCILGVPATFPRPALLTMLQMPSKSRLASASLEIYGRHRNIKSRGEGEPQRLPTMRLTCRAVLLTSPLRSLLPLYRAPR